METIVAAVITGFFGVIVALLPMLRRQARTEKDVSEIQLLLAAIVTASEAKHLTRLMNGGGEAYSSHRGVRDELRSLIGRGFISKKTPGAVHELPDSFILTREFEITERGRLLVQLRGGQGVPEPPDEASDEAG